MEEKFGIKSRKSLFTILIIVISIVSASSLFNQHNGNEFDDFYIESEDIPKISSRPDYIVYPLISNIEITHEDNISLYASSGDGLSWETAYIIENFSIYNPDNYSIFLTGTNLFLIIRNFQIFHNNSDLALVEDYDAVRIIDSSNILIENATLISIKEEIYPDYDPDFYGFYLENVSLNISDVYFHDGFCHFFRNIINSTFEKFYYSTPYTAAYIIRGSHFNNVKILDNVFSRNSIDYFNNEYYGIDIRDSTNVQILRNNFNDNYIHLNNISNLIFQDNFSPDLKGLYFFSCLYFNFQNNSFHFFRDSFFEIGVALFNCSQTTIYHNILTISQSIPYPNIDLIQARYCYDTEIIWNLLRSDHGAFHIEDSDDLFIEHNEISCEGNYVISLGESENIYFRKNSLSGSFSQVFADFGNYTQIFWIFTNWIGYQPIFMMIIVVTTILEFVGIFMLLYSQKQKAKEIIKLIPEMNRYYSSHFPLTTMIVFVFLSSTILFRGNFAFFDFNYPWITLILLTSFSFGLITYKIWKYLENGKKYSISIVPVEKNEVKQTLIKSSLFILIPNLTLFYFGYYLIHIFGRFYFIIYIAIIFILVTLSVKSELETWGLSINRLLIPFSIISLDAVLSCIFLISVFAEILHLIMIGLRCIYVGVFWFLRMKNDQKRIK